MPQPSLYPQGYSGGVGPAVGPAVGMMMASSAPGYIRRAPMASGEPENEEEMEDANETGEVPSGKDKTEIEG